MVKHLPMDKLSYCIDPFLFNCSIIINLKKTMHVLEFYNRQYLTMHVLDFDTILLQHNIPSKISHVEYEENKVYIDFTLTS